MTEIDFDIAIGAGPKPGTIRPQYTHHVLI